MPTKVCLISLGCAKNLVNSEQMLARLAEAGFITVDSPEQADVGIVNTCGFIDAAKMEAIDNILYLGGLREEGWQGKIIVTGCLAQRYGEELLREMPEIDGILGTGSYTDIVGAVESVTGSDRPVLFGDIDRTDEEGDRIISTGPGWAYIKIAEGCSNRCAYCVIPSLRGRYRSRPMENILREAEAMAGSGVKELIVVAQDITRYGTDLYHRRCLGELLEKLCRIEGIEWVRLHYLYPDEIDDELLEVIAREDKILKYLDIPIQHINDGILRAMNRRGTGGEIKALFDKIRETVPGVVLRTSIITGLPGEGEAEFEELCEFLRLARIERAGVFPYSPEEGTPAAEMDRPDSETAQKRAELLMELQASIMDEFNQSRVGSRARVICEGYDSDRGLWLARSWAESPDIDGNVLISGGEPRPGEFCEIEITGVEDGEPIGHIVEG